MPDGLERYRNKRRAEATPEPFGSPSVAEGRSGLFVVQKHAARRLHWDLRLEVGGVLVSWAVPRGPSLDPAEKRLAVHVEDHPVEYADFEGLIPKGNYGAGAVVLWDRGSYVPLLPMEEGLRTGKLLFELRGMKLRGVFTLVRTKRKGAAEATNEWLLIKERDAWASKTGDAAFSQASVLSGLTVEEIADAGARTTELEKELPKLGAKKATVRAMDVEPMLAEAAPGPFSAKGWLFELKIDGYRAIAERSGGRATIRYRRGSDATHIFPDVARAIAALPGSFVIDGEIAVVGDDGKPNFQRLQRRALLERPADIQRATVELPATYFVFDLLAYEGYDLRPLPVATRKELLRRVVPKLGVVRYVEAIAERGEDFFAEVRKLGLEGAMAKRADSPYQAGRSSSWRKIKRDPTCDLVIVGFTRPRGARIGIGALELAGYDGDRLVYAGRVGTGFSDKLLAELEATLSAATCPEPPCEGPIPREKGRVWSFPTLVAEVRYREATDDGLLRHPVFLRLRTDKRPADCPHPGASAPAPAPAPPPKVVVSNPQKLFWPDDGITKSDLVAYYRAAARWMLPYLRDRPLVLTRYPDGIGGKSFYQHDAPVFAPGWMRTERLYSDQVGREVDYFVCDSEESLAYLANLGTIPIHMWASRVATLGQADWCSLDLDPKGAPFAHVVRIARAIRELCDEIGLPTYVKTSGQSGLHVFVPLGARCTHEQARTLGNVLARVVVERLPDIATIARVIADRGGKVYVDFGQNGHGRTLVAPFSVRPIAGARVSAPLKWSEVNGKLDPARFTLKTVLPRMEKLGADPFAGVLEDGVDLLAALDRLRTKVQ